MSNYSIHSIIVQTVYSDAVCTEKILIEELKQDLRDNGKLDCLRKPLEARTDRPETEIEKKRRLEAAWDTGKIIIVKYKKIARLNVIMIGQLNQI